MSVIRAAFIPDFTWGDVVLLAVDGSGAVEFAAALRQAVRDGTARLAHDGVVHDLQIRPGESEVAPGDSCAVWQFDRATATEVIDKLTALSAANKPGHHYVDIGAPADTLMIARDEYLDFS